MSPTTNRFAALACSVGLAALASGCTAVGPNFERPTAPTTASYAAPGEIAPALGDKIAGPWWSAFNAPELDAVIRQALADNPSLAEADATLAQARSALAQVRGEAGPQAAAAAGFNRQRANLQAFGFTSFGDVTLSNPTFNLYSVGGDVGYDLDLFGGRRRGIEGAAARAEAQGWRAEAAYLALTANVAIQAATIAALQGQIAAVEQMIDADKSTIVLVRKANALGGSTALAKVSADSQLEQDRQLLPPLQGQLAKARHALALLVGRAPADWSVPDFSLARLTLKGAAPTELPSVLVRKRPDILAAEADLHAATADIGVATADLYPNIKLTASITQGALKAGDIFSYDASAWDLGGSLTAPLFNGGALKARREQARAAARAASARYQMTVLTAFGQVADALSALSADQALIAASDRAAAQAGERLRLAQAAYRQGGGTLLEILEAQRAQGAIGVDRARAEGQSVTDAVRLFAASGAAWRAGSN